MEDGTIQIQSHFLPLGRFFDFVPHLYWSQNRICWHTQTFNYFNNSSRYFPSQRTFLTKSVSLTGQNASLTHPSHMVDSKFGCFASFFIWGKNISIKLCFRRHPGNVLLTLRRLQTFIWTLVEWFLSLPQMMEFAELESSVCSWPFFEFSFWSLTKSFLHLYYMSACTGIMFLLSTSSLFLKINEYN